MISVPRKTLLSGALALALALVALAVPSLAAAKTATKLSIQTEEDGFSGYVKSSRQSCHSGRKVTLYRKVSGPDKKAGSDTAQPNNDGSQWKISVSRDGSYYAVVKSTSKCGGKTSKTLKSDLTNQGEDAAAAGDGTDGGGTDPAIAKLNMKPGTGTYRNTVTGLLYSPNKDCVDGRRVTFYRQALSDDGDVLAERRIGYSIAKLGFEGSDDAYARSLRITFKVSRIGRVVAKVAATDNCAAAKSRVSNVKRIYR